MKLTTNADLMRIARLCRYFDLPHTIGICISRTAKPILKALQTAQKSKNQTDILAAKSLIDKSLTN